jgi:putative (di)nucleoside polyphosphate hydrolase
MSSELPYRRCAGAALANRAGDVLIGQRVKSREGVDLAGFDWQMPQGGVDDGETPLEAARRELFEETNVSSVSVIAEAPDWLSYDLPANLSGRWKGKYRGQTQKWFLFRFEGEDSEIEIRFPGGGAYPAEFQAWRWERWEALPDLIVPFKREVYRRIVEIFAPIARSALR